MVDDDFARKFCGGGVLTTEVLFYLPDHPSLLQTFHWQTIDEAPKFPRLHQFLDHWRREIDAMIHSIRVAHSDWVGPTEWKVVDHDLKLH